MKAILIIYMIIAAVCFISTLLFLFCSWKIDDAEELYLYEDEPPILTEGRGKAILTFIVFGMAAAIAWPAIPFILLSLLIEEKVENIFRRRKKK